MKCWICKRKVKTAWRLPFPPDDKFRNICDDCVLVIRRGKHEDFTISSM